jgi:hypothetical protein
MPEMKQRGYAMQLCNGSIAADGTLGQLVPHSTAIFLYAILVEESIGRLYISCADSSSDRDRPLRGNHLRLARSQSEDRARTYAIRRQEVLSGSVRVPKRFRAVRPRRTSVHPCGSAKNCAADCLPSTGALASDPRVQPLEPTSFSGYRISVMPAASCWLTYEWARNSNSGS